MIHTRITKSCLRHSLALAALLAIPPLASAQTQTNWVAYIDLGANYPVTAPCVVSNGFGMVNGQPPQEYVLTNYPAGLFPVSELPSCLPLNGQAKILVRGNGTSSFGAAVGNAGAYPNPGTPAYQYFNGLVDMGNVGSLYGVGAGQFVRYTFTNLNPNAQYSFRGTSIRGGTAIGTHDIRWTLNSIEGALSFVNAHSTDPAGPSNSIITASSPVPGLTLTNGQAAFQSGFNTKGMVVGWDNIVPAPDGTFTVVDQSYNGPCYTNDGTGNPVLGTAAANLGYILAAMVITEQSAPIPLSWVTQPVPAITVTQLLTLRLAAQASGSAPYYQWYKEGVGALPGENLPTFSRESVAVTDAGNYYCVVTNRASGSITSGVAQVTVVADTFAPVVRRVSGTPNLSEITVEFSERVVYALPNGGALDTFNYSVDGNAPNAVTLLNPGSVNGGTIVQLTFGAPLVENTVYQLKVGQVEDLATPANVINGNIEYPFRTWVTTIANGVLFEVFTGIGGTPIGNLTNNVAFPNSPTVTTNLSVFSSRQFLTSDALENYGGRLRGMFIPPTSGNWKFALSSDDASQLFLNPTGPNPAGKILITEETSCCNPYGSHVTAAYPLVAGQAYYIEALYKEGGGGDYCHVWAGLQSANPPSAAAAALTVADTIQGASLGYPAAPAGIAGTIGITRQPTNFNAVANQIITFSVATTNTYGLPAVYQWRKDGVDIPGANKASYTFPAALTDDGAHITVAAAIVGSQVLSADAVLHVVLDNVAPTVVSINQLNTFTNISIRFSELMSKTAVESIFGYTFTGPTAPTVTAAALQADGMTLILTVDAPLQLDATYSVEMTDPQDLAGNAVVSPVSFRTMTLTMGFVTFETYSTAGGNDVYILTSDPSFPLNPRERFYLRSINSLEAYPDSSHESFGGRFTGVFVPPTSGNWIFYMSSDDLGELWFNATGSSAADKSRIINVTTCCRPNVEFPSAPQALTAGQPYYIEALYKEGGGGDYCRVVAKLDTDPADPNALAPISSSMLGTFITPGNSSLTISQNPSDQTGVASTPGKILLSQNFNANNGAFTVTNSPTAPAGPWTYNPATGRWAANGGEGVNYSLLHSPTLTVTEAGPVVLTLNHRYNFEADTIRWDGGQVRLSVNGSPYTTVNATNFLANGYKTDIVIGGNNILNGQYAFSGPSDGWSGGTLIQSIVTLGTFNPGDNLSIQFAGAWDEGTVFGAPNWEIDSLVVSEAVYPLFAETFTGTNGNFSVANVGTVTGPWVYNAGSGTWSANGGEGIVASLLNSPTITVGKNGFAKLTFSHRYNFEDGATLWDGGQIRLSVNGGTYVTVPAENFSTNGYAPGPFVGNGIIKDQRGFNGMSAGYTNSAFITSITSLGAVQAGDTLSVQFAGSWDDGYIMPPTPNWELDKLTVEDGIAVPVTFSVMASGFVPGAAATPIAFQWQRNAGTGFENIEGATSSNLTFFVVEADNGSLYRCVVSVPGTNAVSEAALLTVGASAPTMAVVKSGGNAIISWPADAAGYVLDQTTTLVGAPIPWTLVPQNTYQTNGGTISVTVPAGPNNQFYRLRKQ